MPDILIRLATRANWSSTETDRHMGKKWLVVMIIIFNICH